MCIRDRPFINRTGFVLGEGVGCVALSTEKNKSLPCEIFGITTITDNENLTNSSEKALRQLLTDCLTKTNLKIKNIQAIKAHGVGGNSDEMEQSILQERFPNTETILVKPYMGHTLGASGALETAFLIEHLQKTDVKRGHFLNYFLGFGGSNIAWILKVGE